MDAANEQVTIHPSTRAEDCDEEEEELGEEDHDENLNDEVLARLEVEEDRVPTEVPSDHPAYDP
eukprot:12225975-Prorocentrum_lima.AAC.1